MTPDELLATIEDRGVRLVRFLWCGNDGTVRAKASARHGLAGRLGAGIGLTVAMQAMNSLDQLQPVAGMGPVGEVRLLPDLETFRILPYAPRTGAVLTDHVQLNGSPAPVCQRSFLKRMERGLAERGLVLRAAFENEFSLATAAGGAYVPIDSALCFSTIGMTASQDYVDELAAALEAQRIPLEQYYAELGQGQQEISTGHAPALQAADEQILVRETIRAVATRRGLVASLAPKPWLDNAGNPHSSDLKVEERYHRVNQNLLELTVTLDDPKAYTKSWIARNKLPLRLMPPNTDLMEMIPSASEAAAYKKVFAAGK